LDMHHAVRIFIGIGINQNGINNAEYGGGRANSQCQRDDRRECEACRFSEVAKRVTQILQYSRHHFSSLPLIQFWARRTRYCSRSTCIGSVPAARFAGINVAAAATGSTSAITAQNVSTSKVDTP